MFKCKCGVTCLNQSELRWHIALATNRWPVVRCDEVHNDPTDMVDQLYLLDKHSTDEANRMFKRRKRH